MQRGLGTQPWTPPDRLHGGLCSVSGAEPRDAVGNPADSKCSSTRGCAKSHVGPGALANRCVTWRPSAYSGTPRWLGGRCPQPPWGCLGRAGQALSQEAARPGDPPGHPRLNGDPEESWEEPPRPGLSFAKTPRLGMKRSPPSLRTPRRPPGPRVPPQEGDALGCSQPSRGQHGTAVGVTDLLVSVLPAQRTQTNYICL